MAERGSYKPLPGFSLLDVPQVKQSRAGVQLFNAIGDVADTYAGEIMDYQKSLEVEAYNKAVANGKMTIKEQYYASPDKPEVFGQAASNFIAGTTKEYAKVSRKNADRIGFELDLYARELALDVNRNYVKSEGERQRGEAIRNIDTAIRVSDVPLGVDDVKAIHDALKTIASETDKRDPENQPIFGPEATEQIRISKRDEVADLAVNRLIRRMSPEDLEQYRKELVNGDATIKWPVDNGDGTFSTVDARVDGLLPGKTDALINRIDERMREIERDKATFTAAQIRNAENAKIRELASIAQNGDIAGTLTPEQIEIAYGRGEEGKANYDIARTEAIAYHDGYASNPGQRQGIELGAGEDYIRRQALIKGFNQADEDIKKDSALYMIQTNTSVQNAREQMSRQQGTGEPPSPQPYIDALNASYDAWGLPPSLRRILTKEEAAAMAGQIVAPNEDDTPKLKRQQHAELMALSAQYGESASKVMAEIDKEGTLGALLTIADLPPSIASRALDALDQMTVMEPAMKRFDTTSNEIERLVWTTPQMGRLMDALPVRNKQEIGRYAATANALAMKHLMDGDTSDPDEAAMMGAKDVVDSLYRFEGKDENVYVPVAEHSTLVGRGLTEASRASIIEQLGPKIDFISIYGDEAATPVGREEATFQLMQGGSFITNHDQSGVNMITEGGNLIYVIENGQRVPWGATWGQVGRLASDIEVRLKTESQQRRAAKPFGVNPFEDKP